MKNIIVIALICCSIIACETPKINKPLAGPYLGQTPPDTTAKIFAPYLVSSGLYTRDLTISPTGDELFFSVSIKGYDFIMTTKLSDGIWKEARIAKFSGRKEWKDYEPYITPTGNQLLFLSTRPQIGQEPMPGWHYQNIWSIDKTANGWSEPYCLPSPVNTENGEFYPSKTNEGKLYFTRAYKEGNMGIYSSVADDSIFQEPIQQRFKNDSNLVIYNAYISPKEDFLLACVKGLSGSKLPQYCVAFPKGENSWSQLIPFDERVNHKETRATSISLSNNSKFLFFASSKQSTSKSIKPGGTLHDILDYTTKPGNGNSDIYWISAAIIDEIKAEKGY